MELSEEARLLLDCYEDFIQVGTLSPKTANAVDRYLRDNEIIDRFGGRQEKNRHF